MTKTPLAREPKGPEAKLSKAYTVSSWVDALNRNACVESEQ